MMKESLLDYLRDIYIALPEDIRDVYKFFFPIERLALHYSSFLMHSQWFSEEKIKEYQIKELKKLLSHAYKNSRWYRRILSKADISDADFEDFKVLSKLPILKKEDLKHHLEEICIENYKRYFHIRGSSSGSTGTPVQFVADKRWIAFGKAVVNRFMKWHNYDIKLRKLEIMYRMTDDLYIKRWKKLIISAFKIGDKTASQIVKLIKEFKPQVIRSFPMTIHTLIKYLKKYNVKIRPKMIFTTSETLFPHIKEEIEKFFVCKVFDFYGGNETNVTACDCEYQSKHVNFECGILEIVDEKGKPVPEGKEGFVVITDFTNYLMPLIRYEMRDLAVLSKEKCLCGRNSPVIEKLLGRQDDILITKDMNYVSRLDEAFHKSKGIFEAQIVQEKPGYAVIKIVKDEDFQQKDLEILTEELKKRLGEDFEIEFEFVDEIPRLKSGKYKFVINKCLENLERT